MTAEDIHNRFRNENIWEDELPGPGRIAKSLASMLAVKSTLALYKNFYQSIGKPHLFVMPARKTLEWPDVFPFLYLHAAFEGVKESVITKHLVIDEMQDYTPIQYAVMNRLFPCQKTILGDFGQNLNPYHPHTLEDILRIYEGADYVELNRSYRSTFEIMNFAKHIRDVAGLDAVERHGEEPSMVACEDEQDEIRQIKQAILEFEAGENASLGIILKNNRAAREFHDRLSCGLQSGGDRIKLISPDSTHYEGGVSVTSIQMAKGLEFDEVVRQAEEYRDQMGSYFVLETLDTLRKNGRLTGLQAFFATALNIKPVMAGDKGVIVKLEQARGMNKALGRMTEIALKQAGETKNRRLVIAHCNNRARAEYVRDLICSKAQFKDVVITDTAGVATVYANDGGIILTL